LKHEESRANPSKPSSPFASPFTLAPKEFNDLPAPATSQRAFTVQPSPFSQIASPSVTNQRNGVGIDFPASSFLQRSATATPSAQPSFAFSHFASPSTRIPNASNSFGFSPPTSFAQRASSTAPQAAPLTFQPTLALSSSRTKQPLLPDERPELPLSSLRQQQQDRSAILKEPETLPRNDTLFALEQKKQNGAFVNDILHNERSRSLAPELGKVLGRKNEDVDMGGTSTNHAQAKDTSMNEAQQTGGRGTQDEDLLPSTEVQATHPKSFACTNDGASVSTPLVEKPSTPQQEAHRDQLPSPSPSHASLASEPITPKAPIAATTTHGFKIPSTPASASHPFSSRQSVAREARNIRTSTVDSCSTLPVTPRSQYGEPIISPTSEASSPTSAKASRKRVREVELSSDEDEESDYAPSEPDSPLAYKSNKDVRVNLGVKKARVTYGQGSVAKMPPRVMNSVGKKFGFKPKPVVGQGSPMLPVMAARMPGARFPSLTTPRVAPKPASNKAVTTLATPESPSVRTSSKQPASMRAPPKKLPKHLQPPSKRRAALAAETKIHEICEFEEEVRNESAIDDADAMEEAEPVREQRLRADMRGLSITPAPSNRHVVDDMDSVEHLVESESPNESARGDEMIVDTESEQGQPLSTPSAFRSTFSNASDGFIQEDRNDGVYSRSHFLHDRALGDRRHAKATTSNSDEEDLDISEYLYINGVIWRKGDIEELDLTDDTQVTTSRATGAGRQGLECVRGDENEGRGLEEGDVGGSEKIGGSKKGFWESRGWWRGCATS
jgi:hypothetical protein